jgi:ribosomal protein L19E
MQDWREPLVLEDSVVWNQLYDHFLEAVGKIRVFCHPDFSDTIEAALTRRDLEDAIQLSLQQLEKPRGRARG